MKTTIISLVFFLFSLNANAGLLFPYHKLALKDLDQMVELVNSKIKESRKSSSGKVVPLKEALQAVLARPNEDGMISKVITPLRDELENHKAWEKVVTELTTEALNALQNTRAFKADVQVTYAVYLENLIAEFKPDANRDGFERKTLERIRDARISTTKDAQSERKLRMMKTPVPASEIAEQILATTKVEKRETVALPEPPPPPPLEGFFEE